MLPFVDKLQRTITDIYAFGFFVFVFLLKLVFLFFSFNPKQD